MKRLNEDIKKGQFKNIYLLYGEEDYLKRQYKNRLTKAMLPEGDTVNYACYSGKGIPVGEIIDLAETMPFFAERRLIVIEDSGLFKTAAPELTEYIGSMSSAACFLFEEKEVDERGKLFKAVKEHGCAVKFNRQTEQLLKTWLLAKIKKEGKQIKEAVFQNILLRAGTDMEILEKEMEKLFCYTMEKDEITMEDVEAVCTTQIENHIFQMIDAAAVQDKRKALDYYYELLALKEYPPMTILRMLTRQFQLLLNIQELMKAGMDQGQIIAYADVQKDKPLNKYVAGKCMRQCRHFRKSDLRAILEEGVRLENAIKTGEMNDSIGVELFIVSASVQGKG